MMDPHKQLSFIKSGIRILGCAIGATLFTFLPITFAFLILLVAEIVGILEEVVV